jgi:hypothetical protein
LPPKHRRSVFSTATGIAFLLYNYILTEFIAEIIGHKSLPSIANHSLSLFFCAETKTSETSAANDGAALAKL